MKRLAIIIMFLAAAAMSAAAQDGKEIYNRYSGKKGVSSVYISPTMFKMMKSLPEVSMESGEVDFSSIIKTFNGMYIIDIEEPELAKSLSEEVTAMAESGRYELMMEAAEESEKVRIYIVSKGDIVTDFLMFAQEKGSASVISISAEMPFSELKKLIAQ